MSDRDTRICDNFGLVHACARRFIGRGIEYDDLYQAGCIGLIKSADGFDESRGLQFSTYAVPVILGEMRRLFRDGGTIKVSRSLKELSMRTARARESFMAQHGREPSVGELAAALGISAEEAAEAVTAALPPLSLTPCDDEATVGQIDLPVEPPDEALTDRLALRQVLTSLEPRDRALITMRYFQRRTQSHTASELGMTQVQVSRRERYLLQLLREKLIS